LSQQTDSDPVINYIDRARELYARRRGLDTEDLKNNRLDLSFKSTHVKLNDSKPFYDSFGKKSGRKHKVDLGTMMNLGSDPYAPPSMYS